MATLYGVGYMQMLAWDRHINVAGLNSLMGSVPPLNYYHISLYFIGLSHSIKIYTYIRERGLWCLTPLHQYLSYIVRSVLLVEEAGVPGENDRPVTSHWQALPHTVVSSTPRLSGIRTHNVSSDRHLLHMYT